MGRLTFALFAFVCLAVLYQSQAKPLDSRNLLAELLDLERREGGEGETLEDGEGLPRQDGNTGVKRQNYRCLGYGCWPQGNSDRFKISGAPNGLVNQGFGGQNNNFENEGVEIRGVKRQCQGRGCWPQGNEFDIQGAGKVVNQGFGGSGNGFKNGMVTFKGGKRQYNGWPQYEDIQGGGQGNMMNQ